MIDSEIFLQQMALLADRIGRPLAGPTQREYFRQLSAALSTEQFVAAASIAFNAWSGEYRNWPSPQQLIDLVTPVAAPTVSALEAFERVLAVTNDPRISVADQRTKVDELGTTTSRAFYATGGMRDFRDVLESEVPWLRKRFVEAFEAAFENAGAERVASLALNDAAGRVAGLISGLAAQKSLPPTRKVGT